MKGIKICHIPVKRRALEYTWNLETHLENVSGGPKRSQESSHLKIEERENDRLITATPLWDHELGKAVSGSRGKRFSYP